MNKVYKVVFFGLSEKEELFKERISSLGISLEKANKMIKKAPVVLKENESLDYLKKYAAAITGAGGWVKIFTSSLREEAGDKSNIPAMASFIQCPQCGFRQLKKEKCDKCGLDLNTI